MTILKTNISVTTSLKPLSPQPCIITDYEFYVSNDNKEWKLVDQGEFSNIKNNPVWQIRKFSPEKARDIRLCALKNTEGNDHMGYAEADVITN